MRMKNKKQWPVQKIRKGSQIAGLLLAAAGILAGMPAATVVLVGLTVLMGPVFCGWVCPFGFLQEVMTSVGRRLGIKRKRMPQQLHGYLRYARYVLLALVVLAGADILFELLSLDPRANLASVLNGSLLTAAGWLVMAFFLGISLFFERPFCSYLCIEGAKYGLYGLFRPVTIVRNQDTCISCGKCDKACPMQIGISSHEQVRSPQCVTCMACTTACPVENTLKLGVVPVRKGRQVLVPVLFILAIATFLFVLYNGSTAAGQGTPGLRVSGAVVADNGIGIPDGVYDGSGTGFKGTMAIRVSVEDEIITGIDLLESGDDSWWLSRAYNGAVRDILDSQTVDVDTVSGATYSSMGIKEAVADALVKAGGTQVDEVVNEMPPTRGRGRRH